MLTLYMAVIAWSSLAWLAPLCIGGSIEPSAVCTGEGWLKREASSLLQRRSVKFVEVPPLSSVLVAPATKPYNIAGLDAGLDTHKEHQYSQINQDAWVDKALGGMKNGFVLESGAFDGVTHSNSLFFELYRGWDCLLVEADPGSQKALLSVNRRCHVLKAGLSPSDAAGTMKFRLGGEIGGLATEMSDSHLQRLHSEVPESNEVTVPTYPVNAIMAQLQKTTIDYWSLDVEGAEADILQNTDFSVLEVGVITVEHNGDESRRARIQQTLVRNGFERLSGDWEYQDDYYANRAYFAKRGLQFPR